jgi:hypothetical protein
MKRTVAFLSLFTSLSTLICCALPALFVVLGLGASFAGLVSNVPQLIWISENKVIFFAIGAVMLFLGGILQWQAKKRACPIDKREECLTTKDWSGLTYKLAVILYLVGASFAFLPQIFL